MDLYVLDDQLRRSEIIDIYTSLIWTERYSAFGDFELVLPNSLRARSLLSDGVMVTIEGSQRVARIETIEASLDQEGNDSLTVSGRSIEASLDARLAMPALASLTSASKWEFTDEIPSDIIRTMFESVIEDGDVDAGDVIPFIEPGTINPPGNIPEHEETIIRYLDVDTLYNSIKTVADEYNLGFRLVRDGDTSNLYFEVYTGNHRTTSQTTLTPVLFSVEMDTMSDTKELTSSADYANVAYVLAPNGAQAVYADGTDSSVAGFERKAIVVKAEDIDLAAGPALNDALFRRGKEELAKHRILVAFDGEVPQTSPYKYGVDYGLGDLVEQRSTSGKVNSMYVTENITISDAEGVRSYPTLTFYQLVTPGTWLSWDSNQVWSDVEDYWADF